MPKFFKVLNLLLASLVITFSGCDADSKGKTAAESDRARLYEAAFKNAVMTEDIEAKWARSCALCHVAGEGGAPRMGDVEQWNERLSAGNVQMMRSALEGFNRMPPLGYCMDCEIADFAAMINMMAGKN